MLQRPLLRVKDLKEPKIFQKLVLQNIRCNERRMSCYHSISQSKKRKQVHRREVRNTLNTIRRIMLSTEQAIPMV
jgi:conjugal transfer/entry exclusion protein